MNKFYLILSFCLLALVLVPMGSALVNGTYLDNSCTSKYEWLNESLNTIISNIKMYNEATIQVDSGEGTVISSNWTISPTINRNGTNLSLITIGGSPSGSSYFNWSYNTTPLGYAYIQRNFDQNKELNLSNYTGLNFWFKGDGSLNYIFVVLMSGSQQYRFYKNFNMTPTDWDYYYLDFSNFVNSSNTTQLLNFSYLQNVTSIRFTINYLNNKNSSVYFDNISLVDFDLGAISSQRRLHTDIERNGRLNEGVYLMSYLYTYGDASVQGNSTILNYTLYAMDWYVRNQLKYGWQEYSLQSLDSPASTGFPNHAFMNALLLLHNNSRLNENISIFNNGNFTTSTRSYFYNMTAMDASNKTLRFLLNPEGIYSNQYFVEMNGAYLFCTYMNTCSQYESSFDSEIDYLLNFSILETFGFSPEIYTSTKIGLDGGYYGVGILTLSSFIFDSNHNLAKRLLGYYNSSILNLVGGGYGNWNIVNSSRNNAYYRGVFDNLVYNVSKINGLSYLSQASYLSNRLPENYVGASLSGGSRVSNSSNYDSSQSSAFAVYNYRLCSNLFEDNTFIFPSNYTVAIFDLINFSHGVNVTSFNSRNMSSHGSSTTRSTIQFPIYLFAYDSNSSWWIRGDYLRTNTTNWIYSDENGNFSLPIIPTALIKESVLGLTMFTESDGNNVVNSTSSDNQIWITSPSSTSKIAYSNLTQDMNTTTIVNVGSCSNTLGFTIQGTTTGYSKTISPGEYTCTNNQATLSNVMIEKLSGSTIITINTDFTYEELSPICRNVTQAFGSFGDMFGVIVIAIILVFFFTMMVRQEYITPLILSGAIILTMSGVLLIIGSIIVGVLC